jgi:hypothetical protein
MSDVGEQYAVVVVLAAGTHWLEAACFAVVDPKAVVPILSERVAQAYL